jgi:hypothetical protein
MPETVGKMLTRHGGCALGYSRGPSHCVREIERAEALTVEIISRRRFESDRQGFCLMCVARRPVRPFHKIAKQFLPLCCSQRMVTHWNLCAARHYGRALLSCFCARRIMARPLRAQIGMDNAGYNTGEEVLIACATTVVLDDAPLVG